MITRFVAWSCGCSDLTTDGTPQKTCPGHDAESILLLAGGPAHFEEIRVSDREAVIFGHSCGSAARHKPCPPTTSGPISSATEGL